jgi:hypothetical protein
LEFPTGGEVEFKNEKHSLEEFQKIEKSKEL